MAERRAPASKTELVFGLVRIPVGLMKSTETPGDTKYDTAGPNGKPLHTETRLFDKLSGELIDETGEVPIELPPDPAPEEKPDALTGGPEELQRAFMEETGLAGNEQRQVLVEDETGEVVEKEAIRRGVREPDGTFLDLTDGLAEIDEATALERMGVVGFMDIGGVPHERVQGSYYVVAESPRAVHGLKLLAKAMKRTRRVAIVQWTKKAGQTIGIVKPVGRNGALMALELAPAGHMRAEDSDDRILAHAEIPVSDRALAAAESLIAQMSGTRSNLLETLEDEREVLRRELLSAARAGTVEEFSVPVEPEPATADADVEELAVESAERADEITAAA